MDTGRTAAVGDAYTLRCPDCGIKLQGVLATVDPDVVLLLPCEHRVTFDEAGLHVTEVLA